MTKMSLSMTRNPLYQTKKITVKQCISYVFLYLSLAFAMILSSSTTGYTDDYKGISISSDSRPEIRSTTYDNAECKDKDGKILIDFEGLPNHFSIGDAYSACGVYFSDDALSIIDRDDGGTGNFANEPSPNTILFFLNSDRATLNFAVGIVNGFSFYYTAIGNPGFIKVHSEENRQGEELAYLELAVTPPLGQGDPTGSYDNWQKIGVEFEGIAKSIDFGGTANQIGFDNITLNSAEASGTKVDHFQFADINDQKVNVWFKITIIALDQYENRVATFNERVDLSTYYGNYVVPENENGAVFVNGNWEGNVKIIRANNDYFLMAFCEGSSGKSNTFNVISDLPINARLEGTVLHRNTDNPVEGADVFLVGYSYTYSRTTSDKGIFVYTSIPPGAYIIKSSKDNLSSEENELKILPGTTNILEIHLRSKDKKPLFILPGILGSTAVTSEDSLLHPHLPETLKVSQSLLKPLDPHGSRTLGTHPVGFAEFAEVFQDDRDVYYVPYDWRVSIKGERADEMDSAWYLYLKRKIDRILADNPDYEKVDVIAHSMGGLLARAYIQSGAYENDIDKFVMVGTPNMGSCNTYMIDEGGEPKRVDDILKNNAINTYDRSLKDAFETMEAKKYNKATNKQIMDFVSNRCKTLHQIAPTYPFLKYQYGGGALEEAKYSMNSWLKGLNAMPTISRMVGSLQEGQENLVETKLYLLDGKNTMKYIHVVLYGREDGTYPSGEPYDSDEEGRTNKEVHMENNGDGTVIAAKAGEPFKSDGNIVKESEDYGSSHASMLTSDALVKDIYEFLTGKTLAKVAMAVKETPPSIPATTFSLNIEGDVQPYMLDPQGNASGANTDTGAIEENIPQSNVIFIENLSAIHISNPSNGEYKVYLKGFCEGEFAINLSYFDNVNEIQVARKARGFYDGGIVSFKVAINAELEDKASIIYPVLPPTEVIATDVAVMTHLSWQASAAPELSGYKVYGRTIAQPIFTLLGTTSETSYNANQLWNADGSNTTRYYVVTATQADGSESFYEYMIENRIYVRADFTADVISGSPPLTVKFTNCTEGVVTSWQWDFDGDGEIDSTEQNPTNTYTEEGSYTVTLFGSGETGADHETKPGYINVRTGIPVTLKEGWNLLSLFLEPDDSNIASVLGSITNKYRSVWAFKRGAWKLYDPANPGFSDLTTMEAGWGYWLNMTESATLKISGTTPSNTLELISGWNLVGYNSSTAQNVAVALATINAKYISVWTFIDGDWKVYDPANPGFSNLTTMEPGYGFWINATEECTWTLP